jgi:hypothetical protein
VFTGFTHVGRLVTAANGKLAVEAQVRTVITALKALGY